MYKLYHGDCIMEMDKIPDKSVDLVLTDLPYGTTACKWDSVIPLKELWVQWKRVLKDLGTVVLFGAQPFTSVLVSSNLEWFKYCWVWQKTLPTNFLNAKNRPTVGHEDIAVFSSGTTANCSPNKMTYIPQMQVGMPYKKKDRQDKRVGAWEKGNRTPFELRENINTGTRFPNTVIRFSNNNHGSIHPTQKPTDLLEYIIRTYTLEGNTVLDSTMGVGSTIVAANNTNRNSIGIELYPLPDKPVDKKTNPNYFFLAQERIERELNRPKQVELV